MKTPQQWVDQFTLEPMNESEAMLGVRVSLEDVATIQRDAFDAGRVAGLREAGNLDLADKLDCDRLMREADLKGLVRSQPKDTSCSKNTP